MALIHFHMRSQVRGLPLTGPDIDDVTHTAITNFLTAAPRLTHLPDEEALKYLMQTARNAGLSMIRRRHEDPAPADDLKFEHDRAAQEAWESGRNGPDAAVLSLLERDATLSRIRAALNVLLDAGDTTTARIVLAWLDMADRDGQPPSLRAVGEATGVHHTTAARSLKRLRTALQGGRGERDGGEHDGGDSTQRPTGEPGEQP